VQQPEGNKPLRRPRSRYKYNIKKDVKSRMGKCGLDSSGLKYWEMGGCCKHGNGPMDSIKCEEFLD
jgi:hypothetical protein